GFKRESRTTYSDKLISRIKFYFYNYRYSDILISLIISKSRSGLFNIFAERMGQILVSQNRLYSFYREVFLEQVQKRKEATFIYYTNFIISRTRIQIGIYIPITKETELTPIIFIVQYILRKGATEIFINFFRKLATYALFIKGSNTDQIALYTVFGNYIQDTFASFIQL
ncbi:unnamed protein product, partial [Clonostachys rhizophaga]